MYSCDSSFLEHYLISLHPFIEISWGWHAVCFLFCIPQLISKTLRGIVGIWVQLYNSSIQMLSENCICQLTGIMNNSHNTLNIGYYILVHYDFIELSFSVTGEKNVFESTKWSLPHLGNICKEQVTITITNLHQKKKTLRILLIFYVNLSFT